MARIRTVKPEIARHEGLYDLEIETQLPIRFAWCMLFTVCDREGRFAWRPRTLKAEILPHDELDFSRVLHAWLTRGFVVRYRVGHEWFGWVPTFTRHQVINNRESPSMLPDPTEADEVEDHRNQPLPNACGTREARVDDASSTREVHAQAERKGREGKGKEGKRGARGEANGKHPPASRGTVIPDDFALTDERRAVADREGVPPEREFDKFCDYWRSVSGAKARKRDWDATWRNWCRKAAEHGGQASGSRSSSGSDQFQGAI